jgi:cyclophilin family peptidyl-prolyl cis-trans isomerase
MRKRSKKILAITAVTIASFTSLSNATIVQIQTSYGNIEVNLFDTSTPKTVANFLSYIEDNAYDNSIIHRSIRRFVTQGGGFYFNEENVLTEISEKPSIINEPIYSSLRGTIAMAKISGDPDSATSQWFINLEDNAIFLDNQNGGFTVFGQVSEAGMAVIDTIAAMPTANKGGAYREIPLEDTSAAITQDNTVVIDTITVIDTTIESAAALEPALNPVTSSANNPDSNSDSNPDISPNNSSSSSAGSLGFLLTTLLASLGFIGRKKTNRPSQTLSSPLQ